MGMLLNPCIPVNALVFPIVCVAGSARDGEMQAITTASVLALPVDMGEVTESSYSDEVPPCLFLCFALAGSRT